MKLFLMTAMAFLAPLFLSCTAKPPRSFAKVTSESKVGLQPLSKSGGISESTQTQIIVDLIWAAGLCKDDRIKCKQVPENFTTHGVWREPEVIPGARPGKDFNSAQVRKLEDDLVKYFPDLNKEAGKFSIGYYRKIFFSHGKYFYPEFSSAEYFSLAIKLTKIHGGNILTALENQGIKPEGGRHKLGNIVRVIESYTGFTPKLVSNKIPHNGRNYFYLTEIRVCMDMQGRHFVQCKIDTFYLSNKYVYFAEPPLIN